MGKESVTFLQVDEASAGQRIDNFLLKIFKGVPKSHIYRILRRGEVRVNKGRVGAERRLAAGDVIRIPPLRLPETKSLASAPAPARTFPVVFEDEAMLVIDKPAGVAVHGGSGVDFGVIEQLRRARPGARFLELAHRLDRETSGLLVIAKKRAALVRLHELFRDGEIEKRYLAMVKGHWRDKLRHVRLPLCKYLTPEGERRVRVSAAGKEAHSIVCLVGRWRTAFGDFSLLEVELKSGRTHQIRVHLAHLGFPILGDEKYGDFELNKILQKAGLKRMFLHALSLKMAHPVSGAMVSLTAPMPAELKDFMPRLGCDDAAAL